MAAPASRILDAGCGPGGRGAVLHRAAGTCVGVDADPELIAAAREDHPGPQWVVADLADLDLSLEGIGAAVRRGPVVAGNVLAFVAPGDRGGGAAPDRGHLRPDWVRGVEPGHTTIARHRACTPGRCRLARTGCDGFTPAR